MLVVSEFPVLQWHLVYLSEVISDIEIEENPNCFCNVTIEIRGAVDEVLVVAEMSLYFPRSKFVYRSLRSFVCQVRDLICVFEDGNAKVWSYFRRHFQLLAAKRASTSCPVKLS
jgi:hypothetical protein